MYNMVMDIQLISRCKVAISECAKCDINFVLGALHDMQCPLCNVQYDVSTMHYAIYAVRSLFRQGILLAVGATIYNLRLGQIPVRCFQTKRGGL